MTTNQPVWPLPLGTDSSGKVYKVHRDLMIALVRAIGGAVVFSHYDLLCDNEGVVLEQFVTDSGGMTLRVRERDEGSL